ncbi:hypothetical protein FO519_000697 [Halicephalobus sp. NKZ332]|nr:hypothetical protein FO519_000697 [Halicephalobus sp. NKZ332]
MRTFQIPHIMTDDEPSLRPSNNPVSSKSLTPATTTSAGQICSSTTVKKEISDPSVETSLSEVHYVNGMKVNGPDSQIKTEIEDVKCISNGISQMNTKTELETNGHLDQQPCSSKEDIADDTDEIKFKCPHTTLFIDAAFPDLDKVSREKLEEFIIDDMSLILFNSLDDYKVFKIQEDSRRVKLETIRKIKEEEELARLAAIKREKLKSKHDAMKEKRRERNRQLKDQRALEREERREQRERMHQQKWLSREERKRWREEYLQRKRERAERRQMKVKKQEERAKKGQQLQSTSLEAVGTASSSRSESGIASLNAQPSVLSAPYSSKTPLHSATCLPGPSRPNAPYLMNDFSNPKAATEALVSLVGINSANQRSKRPFEESSPIAHNRTNGVIFSPSSKMPRLDSLSNPISKVDSNEATRHLQSLSNGYFQSEQLHGFENSLLGSLPPSTSIGNPQMPNLNPMFMPGTSKAAAQVANFMRNSQAPQLEIQQALMQNPQLAVIFTQALATMKTAIDPIADSRINAAISSLMDHKPIVSAGLPHSAIPGMSQASIAQNTAFSQMAMAAAAGVQVPAVNGSLLAASNQSVSTKLPIGVNSSIPLSSATAGPNKLPASTPSTSSGTQPKLPSTTSSIGIQFPKDASLGSQLAGAAVLGHKPFTQASVGTAPSTPSQWCNKHVTIAQTISNRTKTDTKGTHQSTNHSRNPAPNDPTKKNPLLQNSMPPPSVIPQKPVQQQQPPLSAANVLRPQLPPQPSQMAPNQLLNLHGQNLILQNSLNSQPAAMAPWQMLRFPQTPLGAAPGITTGIPPQQNPSGDLASQELAKFYRMNQQIKQEQSVPRPPSQQMERAASVATGLPNTNLPPSSTAAFSALLQNHNMNTLLAGAGVGQSNAQQQLNAHFMNGQQNADTVMRLLQMQMHQQQAMQAYNPMFSNGLLSQFPNLLGSSGSATMGMNPNSVRPNNMFNFFMDRDKQLSAALAGASQSNPVIAPPTTMAPRQTFPPNGASTTNALQQFLQQNSQLSLSTHNGLPQSSVASVPSFGGFDLAGAQQLLALQQSRPQMISQPLMNNNTAAARNLLDMSQLAKLQFPQGGQKRE